MNAKQLRERWQTAEGRALADEVTRFLVGQRRDLPDGVALHEGRHDLRGLALPTPERGAPVSSSGVHAELMSGLIELRRIRWERLDLSHARLPSLRFFESVVDDCCLDGALCRDWRLWATEIKDSSFSGADLREAALGTWQDERTNTWRNVSFDRTDMRGALALGCTLDGCSFHDARLNDVQFQQVTIHRCRFAGVLKDVLFDCREIAGKPAPGVFVDVDFSDASFENVEFRGCRFEGVTLPRDVYAIAGFPKVARRVLELLDDDDSVEARMLRAELGVALKMPGADDSFGVFNRRDYLASGGERLADLAESVLMEAAGDASR